MITVDSCCEGDGGTVLCCEGDWGIFGCCVKSDEIELCLLWGITDCVADEELVRLCGVCAGEFKKLDVLPLCVGVVGCWFDAGGTCFWTGGMVLGISGFGFYKKGTWMNIYNNKLLFTIVSIKENRNKKFYLKVPLYKENHTLLFIIINSRPIFRNWGR